MDLIKLIENSVKIFISNGVKIEDNKYKLENYMFNIDSNNIIFYKNGNYIFNLYKNNKQSLNINALDSKDLNEFIDFIDFKYLKVINEDKNKKKIY